MLFPGFSAVPLIMRVANRIPLLTPGRAGTQRASGLCLLGLNAPVLLTSAVVGRLCHLQDPADVGDGLALGDQLLGGLELADDLLRCVPGAFHDEVPGPVWPAVDSQSHWTDLRGPRHPDLLLWDNGQRQGGWGFYGSISASIRI